MTDLIQYSTQDPPYPILWRTGCAGLHAMYLSAWRTCDRVSQTDVSIPDDRLSAYYGEVADGGWILDKRVDLSAAALISLPLIELALEDGEKDPCPEIPEYMHAALGGAFQGLATIQKANPSWGGLDRVSVAEYVRRARAIGVRVARRRGNQVHWEDGAVDEIRPEAYRYILEDGTWVED